MEIRALNAPTFFRLLLQSHQLVLGCHHRQAIPKLILHFEDLLQTVGDSHFYSK